MKLIPLGCLVKIFHLYNTITGPTNQFLIIKGLFYFNTEFYHKFQACPIKDKHHNISYARDVLLPQNFENLFFTI